MSKKTGKKTVSDERRRQIRNRIGWIIFLSISAVTLLLSNFYLQDIKGWSDIDSNLNIFLLINLSILLLVTVTMLIIRNLVKLLYERRQRKLGFRLKFKLTLAFMLVSLLPMVMFFFVAHGLLKDSLDFWFKGQVTLAINNSIDVISNFNERRNRSLEGFGEEVIEDYLAEIRSKPTGIVNTERKRWFQRVIKRYQLDGIIWYDSELNPLEAWFGEDSKKSLWRPLSKKLLELEAAKFPVSFDVDLETAHLNKAVLLVKINGSSYYMEAFKALLGGAFSDLSSMSRHIDNFRAINLLEKPIRGNFTAYLLLFTILINFGGIWFGYYLAANMVKPIETLVEGTRRIAKGDLDFQIDLRAGDEIGMLLESFNSMTKELQENRRKLARSREALILTNKTLEERNILVELVLENIQTGILSVDNSGYVNGMNTYMIKLFQIDRPEALNKHYLSVLTKEQRTYFEQLNKDLTGSKQNSVKTDAYLKFKNSSIHVSMELFLLKNNEGRSLGRLLVLDNLTEIDRFTRASAWREVARRIAHEIKNPLTPIQLSAQRIRRKYLDDVSEAQMLDDCTSVIIKEVNRLKNMVNEFSKFARLPEINPSLVDINVIMKEARDLFTQGLPSNIKINFSVDPDVPKLMLDEEQMKRVLTNLIDNAVAAVGDEGEINLLSSYSEKLKMVRMEVSDNGCGVHPMMINRIFEPYVTTKKEGTGLGLAIVQQIVSDHGGFIRLKNNKTKGAKFFIELPV